MNGSKERVFIMTQTHIVSIFGVILFVMLKKQKTKKQTTLRHQLNG